VNDLDALPEAARNVVALVEREVGVPVRIVGTGAERASYVIWS
jgi:adenylosuccinate synthase